MPSIRASIPSLVDGISSIDLEEIPPYLRERAHHDRVRPPATPATPRPAAKAATVSANPSQSPRAFGGILPPRPRTKTAAWRIVRIPNRGDETILCVDETAEDVARFFATEWLLGMSDNDIRRLVAISLDHWVPSGKMSRNIGHMKLAEKLEYDPEFASLANIETGSWSRVATWPARMFTREERWARRCHAGNVHRESAGVARFWIPDWQAIFDEESRA